MSPQQDAAELRGGSGRPGGKEVKLKDRRRHGSGDYLSTIFRSSRALSKLCKKSEFCCPASPPSPCPGPYWGRGRGDTETSLFGEGVASFLGEEGAGPRRTEDRQRLERPRYLNAYCVPDSLPLLLLPPAHQGPLRERATGQLIWSLEGAPPAQPPFPLRIPCPPFPFFPQTCL